MPPRRWDDDKRGRGVADARSRLPAISELAELAARPDWVAEDPDEHLMPGLRERIEISGLSLEASETDKEGVLTVRLTSRTKQSRREIRQSVWSIIGGAAELTSMVHESITDGVVRFDVVTGLPPSERFATHGHTLRIEVAQPDQ